MKFALAFKIPALSRRVLAGSIMAVIFADGVCGADVTWSGAPQFLTSANGGDDVTLELSTTVTLGAPGSTVLENSLFNRSGELPGVTTLTINSADATHRTLVSAVTTLAGANGQSLVIAGSADFRMGLLGDGGFSNVQLVKDGGTGELILDGISNDLDGALLRVVNGTVSVEGGGGLASPISTLPQIVLDGPAAKLRLGTPDGSATTFTTPQFVLLVNDSGTLEHTAVSNDTLAGSVAILNGKTLTANVTAGSLALTGGVAGGGLVGGQVGGLSKIGGGTLTLSGPNSYTGATAVSAGTLIARSASALGIGGTANVSVLLGAAMNYDAAADTALNIGGTLAVTGGAGTVIGGSIGSTATSAQINVAGAASITNAAHKVNIYGVNVGTHATGLVTLIHGGAGSALNPAATPTLGAVYNNTDFTVGTFTRTASDLQVNIIAAPALTSAYWTGGLGGVANVWAASNGIGQSNWVAVSGGASQALVPGSATDVIISSSSVTTAPTATVLGADMTIKSLTIADPASGLGLNADAYALTITPANPASGIVMNAGVPSSYIAANVSLGSAQNWTNNSAGGLVVSGTVSGTSALTKSGTGTLTLSGTNTHTGSTTVSAGTLALGSGGSLANTAINVSSTATFAARPGSASVSAGTAVGGAAGATLTLNAGSAFSMVDGATGTFNLLQNVSFAAAGFVSGVTAGAAPTLTFELGNSSIDVLNVTKAVAPGIIPGVLNFQSLTGLASLAPGDYTFINAASGLGPMAFTLGSSTITVGGNTYNLSLANSTASAEVLTIAAVIPLGNNSQILITSSPDSASVATGASAKAVAFGRVMQNSIQTTTLQMVGKTGSDATTYTVTPSGAVTTTIGGASFAAGSQSTSGTITLTTTATGSQTGTVTIANTVGTSLAAGLGSADANDVFTLTGTVLKQRGTDGASTLSASSIGIGRILLGGTGGGTTTVATAGGSDSNYTRVTVAGGASVFDGSAGTGTNQTRSVSGTVNAASGTLSSLAVTTAESAGVNDTVTYTPIPVPYTATPLALRSVTATPLALGRQLATTNLNSLTRQVTLNSSGTNADTTDVTVDGSLIFNGASNTQNKSITGQNAVLGASGTFYSVPVVSRETGLGDTYANVAVGYTATPLGLRSVSGTAGDLGRVMSGTNLSTLSRSVTFNSTGSQAAFTDVTVDGTLLFSGVNTQLKSITGQNAVIAASGTFYIAPVLSAETGLGDTYANVAVSYTATPLQDRVITADTVGFGLVHVGAAVSEPATLRTTGDNNSRTAVSVANASSSGFSLTGGTNPVFSGPGVTDARTLGATLGTPGAFANVTALTLTPGTEVGVAGTQTPVGVVVAYSADVFSGSALWTGPNLGSWGQAASAHWTDTATASIHAAPGTFGSGFTGRDTAIFAAAALGTVNLDGVTPSLAAVTFSGGSHIIAQGPGTGLLTLKRDAGPATITASGGNQSITAPVVLSSNVLATVPLAGDALTLSGGLTGAGQTLTKEGAGTLTLTGLQDYAALYANGGLTNLVSALGSGAAELHASAAVHIHASQSLAALVIGDGVEVTFGDGLSFGAPSENLVEAVPEPGSMALLLAGGLGVLGIRRRR